MKKSSFRWNRRTGSAVFTAGILACGLLLSACGKDTDETSMHITETDILIEEESTPPESSGAESTQEESSTQESVSFDWEAEEIGMAPTGTYDGIVCLLYTSPSPRD